MNDFTVRVTGLRELGAAARRTETKIAPFVKAANLKIAERVAVLGRAHAPKLSGRLAAGVKGRANMRTASVTVGGNALPYAQPIHWGWPKHHIKANPFLTKAAHEVEVSAEEWYNDVATGVTEEFSVD